jgi:TonB family protein
MKTFHSLSIAVILTAFSCFTVAPAQDAAVVSADERYEAPVVWTRYKVSSQELSFLMPKLPVVREYNDACSQTASGLYTAYAEGAVYEIEWRAKSYAPVPKYCTQPREVFSAKSRLRRLDELRLRSVSTELFTESDTRINAREAKVFRWEGEDYLKTRWVIEDFDRWVEMAVSRRKDALVDEDRFLSALGFKGKDGAEIGAGSPRTLGDAEPEAKEKPVDLREIMQGLIILSKPRPGYTDRARQANVQGTVVLRVTFLKSGGIGDISVEKELKGGLTEQATGAAKRIMFLPARQGGVSITVVKQIEYTFSIY